MPALRWWCLALLFSVPAHADMYRWIDPQTGSVKLSNSPPLDPTIAAEVIPFRAVAPQSNPQPTKPVPVTGAGPVAELEARWRSMHDAIALIPTRSDFARAGQGIAEHLKAYEALSEELNRMDPAGAARRRAADEAMLARMRPPQAAPR